MHSADIGIGDKEIAFGSRSIACSDEIIDQICQKLGYRQLAVISVLVVLPLEDRSAGTLSPS